MTLQVADLGFHQSKDALASSAAESLAFARETRFTYTFENLFHPLVGDLIEQLNRKSLAGMLDPVFLEGKSERPDQPPPTDSLFTYFAEYSKPQQQQVTNIESQPREIDLGPSGPCAGYNWELLYHIPVAIAVHLSKNQRFAEAQRWFHYVFDPTCNDTSQPVPQRFWTFLGFRQQKTVAPVVEALALLSKPDAECDGDELMRKRSLLGGYAAIKNKPFQPHAVARGRPLAYQYSVVMKYLDNLIAWGDYLFRQDTVESINEATQRYVLAANVLGHRPQRIPQPGGARPRTFAELKRQGLDAMGNALVELESQFPFNRQLAGKVTADGDLSGPLFGIGRTLYFCIPRNDKMLGYWDAVADRLFKIRHCMNIEGVVRQLALFDPPIDPGMLVKATAAGLDIGSVVSGLNQPLTPVRSRVLVQRALELANEVRQLGSALLSAIEKRDAEALALLRQGQETRTQRMQREVCFLQWKQSQEGTEALLKSRQIILGRYRFYSRLLGRQPDTKAVPDSLTLDRRKLSEDNFDETYEALVGQYDKAIAELDFAPLTIAGDEAPANQSGSTGQGRLHLSSTEDKALNEHLPGVKRNQLVSLISKEIAPTLSLIPEFSTNFHFWGIGGQLILGGRAATENAKTIANVYDLLASRESHDASSATQTAAYERRSDEWILQANHAARELMSVGRQIIASLIGEQVARNEHENVRNRIEQSREVEHYLHDKFSNQQLYGWLQGELSRLYYEYYRFAFDTARKAEQAMKQELMRQEVDATAYINFNYWDAGRKGLLSGEALYLDIKRMELAYHDSNQREYELTKHVSLRQLDPAALLTLKATGKCETALPEWLFDLDCPGHYLRRIKTASLSIPSVAGPYTSVNCTLSLLKSTLRLSPLLKGGDYLRQPDDARFVDYYGTIESIVTSRGNNDGGLFDVDLHDERLLPFEGAGAESRWRIELPESYRQFDYDTIADVIVHVRYTARQGGSSLKQESVKAIDQVVAKANDSGLALLLDLRHDFPADWHKCEGGSDYQVSVTRDYFPYFTQGKSISLESPRLHRVENGKHVATTLSEINLAFNAKDAFGLTLKHDLIGPKKDSASFVTIGYALT